MNNGGVQIRIGDLLYALRQRWKMILALTALGLIAGLAVRAISFIQGTNMNYLITASVAVTPKTSNGYSDSSETITFNDYHLSPDMVDAVSYVIRSGRNLESAISSMNLGNVTASQISDNLTLTQYNETQIIELELQWRSADEGKRLMNAIISSSRTTLQKTLKIGDVTIINQPASSRQSGGSALGSLWVFFGFLGLFIGLVLVILELIMRPTLLNPEDVENILGLESVGTIPKVRFPAKRHLLDEDAVPAPVQKNYMSAAYILDSHLADSPHHCLYVTSTLSGEGRSTAAACLALALSDMERRVLLIDLDLRSPSLGGLFLEKTDYLHSLNAIYRGDADPQEAIVSLSGFLDLLPIVLEHSALPLDPTLFDFLRSLKEGYDFVIIDAAPVGEVPDTLSLSQVADSALFVIRYDRATIPAIEGCIDQLDKSGIRILGALINAVPQEGSPLQRRSSALPGREEKKKRASGDPLSAATGEGGAAGSGARRDPLRDLGGSEENDIDIADEEAAHRDSVMDSLMQIGEEDESTDETNTDSRS